MYTDAVASGDLSKYGVKRDILFELKLQSMKERRGGEALTRRILDILKIYPLRQVPLVVLVDAVKYPIVSSIFPDACGNWF